MMIPGFDRSFTPLWIRVHCGTRLQTICRNILRVGAPRRTEERQNELRADLAPHTELAFVHGRRVFFEWVPAISDSRANEIRFLIRS